MADDMDENEYELTKEELNEVVGGGQMAERIEELVRNRRSKRLSKRIRILRNRSR